MAIPTDPRPAAPDPATDKREVAWLIERGQSEGSPVTYWLCDDRGIRDVTAINELAWPSGLDWGWTTVARLARRFPTELAAERYIDDKSVTYCRASEHVFLDRAAPGVPAEEPAALDAGVEALRQKADHCREAGEWSDAKSWNAKADRLSSLIQRAHDAEARATTFDRNWRQAASMVDQYAVALADAEQRIAALTDLDEMKDKVILDAYAQLARLTSERSALRGKIEARLKKAQADRSDRLAYASHVETTMLLFVLAQLPAEDET